MSTATDTRSVASAPSLVSSAAFRTFVVVFAIAAPIIYMVCEMRNWPLFTYHPATNQVDLFYVRPRRGEGPAMYWYGWTATSMLAAAALAFLATFLPQKVADKIPLALVWIVPVLAIPLLFYSLMPFWTR